MGRLIMIGNINQYTFLQMKSKKSYLMGMNLIKYMFFILPNLL